MFFYMLLGVAVGVAILVALVWGVGGGGAGYVPVDEKMRVVTVDTASGRESEVDRRKRVEEEARTVLEAAINFYLCAGRKEHAQGFLSILRTHYSGELLEQIEEMQPLGTLIVAKDGVCGKEEGRKGCFLFLVFLDTDPIDMDVRFKYMVVSREDDCVAFGANRMCLKASALAINSLVVSDTPRSERRGTSFSGARAPSAGR